MQFDINLLIETINEEKTPIKEQLSIALSYPPDSRKKIIENASQNFIFDSDNDMIKLCNLALLLEEASYNEYTGDLDSILSHAKDENVACAELNQNIIKNAQEEQINTLLHVLTNTPHTEPYKLCKAFLFIKRKMYQRALPILKGIESRNRRIRRALNVLKDICNFHLGMPMSNNILNLIRNGKLLELSNFLEDTPKLSVVFLRFLSSPFSCDKKVLEALWRQVQKIGLKGENATIFGLLEDIFQKNGKNNGEYKKNNYEKNDNRENNTVNDNYMSNNVNENNNPNGNDDDNPDELTVLKFLFSLSLSSFRDKKDVYHALADLLIKKGDPNRALNLAKFIDEYYLIGKVYHLKGQDHLAREYYRCSDGMLAQYANFVIQGYPINVKNVFPNIICPDGVLTINDLNRLPISVAANYLQFVCDCCAHKFGIGDFKFTKPKQLLDCILKKDYPGTLRAYNALEGEFVEKYAAENNKVFYLEKIRRKSKNDVVSYFDDSTYLNRMTEEKIITRIGPIEKHVYDFYTVKLQNALKLAPEEYKKYIYYNLWILNKDMPQKDLFIYDFWSKGIEIPNKSVDVGKYPNNWYVVYRLGKVLEERGDKRSEDVMRAIKKYLDE